MKSDMGGFAVNYRARTATDLAGFPPLAYDPLYSSVVLLLPLENDILDKKGNPTALGGAGTLSSVRSRYGAGLSLLPDPGGTLGYLTIPDATAFNLTSGDWCIEASIYTNAVTGTGSQIIDKDGKFGIAFPQYSINMTSAGHFTGFVGSGNGTSYQQTVDGGAVATLGWHDVCFNKTGTTLRTFVDGVITNTATQSGTMISGGRALVIGYSDSQPETNSYRGHVNWVRITKGNSRYTANYTPAGTVGFPTA